MKTAVIALPETAAEGASEAVGENRGEAKRAAGDRTQIQHGEGKRGAGHIQVGMTHSQLWPLEQLVTRHNPMSQSSHFEKILIVRDQEVDAHEIFVCPSTK